MRKSQKQRIQKTLPFTYQNKNIVLLFFVFSFRRTATFVFKVFMRIFKNSYVKDFSLFVSDRISNSWISNKIQNMICKINAKKKKRKKSMIIFKWKTIL